MPIRRNKIADLLAEREISIYRLAKEADLTYQGLHNLVRSKQIPDGTAYGTLRRIAEVLGVTIADLEETGSEEA